MQKVKKKGKTFHILPNGKCEIKSEKIIKENYMICSRKVVVRWLSGGFH